MEKKIVVFGTTALYKTEPQFEGQEPVFEHRCRSGRHEAFYSTGRLETALEREYRVYVVSVRWVFYDCDLWWMEMIPEDDIFHNGFAVIGTYPAQDLNGRLMYTWRSFYEKLGIEWNENFTEWNEPLMHLIAHHGIVDGSIVPGHH